MEALPLSAVEGYPEGAEGTETAAVWPGNPRDDCSEDTPFDNCRRPFYARLRTTLGAS